MKVGDKMECALLKDGKPIGRTIPVEVREITSHWQTGDPVSVRVKFTRKGREGYVWVQACMLTSLRC